MNNKIHDHNKEKINKIRKKIYKLRDEDFWRKNKNAPKLWYNLM